MSDAHALIRLNRQAQAKLAEREALVDERIARLRAEMDKALTDKADVRAEREALAKAEQVYGRLFGPIPNNETTLSGFAAKIPDLKVQLDGQDAAKPRARLGPQRYLMFDALSRVGDLGLVALASEAHLNTKRVKDQMASDVRLGFVVGDDSLYRLTPAGTDLLERYRAYKRSRNQPLPSRDHPPTEDDHDENETDEAMEGVTQE